MAERDGSFFSRLQQDLALLLAECRIDKNRVKVSAETLSPEEAFGCTRHEDAVECILQAELLDCRGQAFTLSRGHFNGSLADVLALPLTDDFQRALYIAVLNAITCYAGKVANTIHCRNEGSELCASQVVDFFHKNYGKPSILMIGFQAELAEPLSRAFPLTVLEIDPALIGQRKSGILIQDGNVALGEHIAANDVIFVTGSTISNNSIDIFERSGRRMVFYGITGSGAAALLGIPRFCPRSTAGRKL